MDAITTLQMLWRGSKSAWRLWPLWFFLLALFAFAAFFHRLEALLAALGAFGGAFDQLSTHQFDFGELGAVAFSPTQANDASIAAVPLAKFGSKLLKQLLNRSRRSQKRGRLPAR